MVELKRLPAYVLVKITRTRATQLEGLEEAVMPVEPATIKFQIKVKQRVNGKMTTIIQTITRKQFPITAAYTFTNYRSQGQTIPYVIVDIASPPSGTLSLFNLYVALSRSSEQQTIRLLRDFDERIFMKVTSHSSELILEGERLEHLDGTTREWWDEMERRIIGSPASCG